MPEFNSTQRTSIASGYKVLPSADHGRKRLFYARYVNGASTLAINDTIYLGDLPAGARLCKDWLISCGAGTASSTIDVGLRLKSTQAEVDLDGIASVINTAAAGIKDAVNGALILNGAEYVTTAAVEVVATVKGAVFAASQAIVFEGSYVQD